MEIVPFNEEASVSGCGYNEEDVAEGAGEHLLSSCEEAASVAIVTDGGTKEWIPICSEDVKPLVGMKFRSRDHGYEFYKKYACVCGFSVRKSTVTKESGSDLVKWQYYVCSRAGYKENTGTKGMRKRVVTRVGCEAKLALKYVEEENGGYEVYLFHEGHTHPLVSEFEFQFERGGRNMNFLHKKFIFDNSKVIRMLGKPLAYVKN